MDFRQAVEKIHRDADIEHNPPLKRLRELSMAESPEKTRYGSLAFRTRIRGRSAKLTEIVEAEPSPEQREVLAQVAEYLGGKPMVMLERSMCTENPFLCRAYVSREHAHIAYMWGSMLFTPGPGEKTPDFINVQVPQWPQTRILADAESGITFILGSDYTGELKKANLRMAMHRSKKKGGMGLHAGAKLIRVANGEGKIMEKGALLFGLSATGKTTLTCHHHWLDKSRGEGVVIRQDDVVLMNPDSSCRGTEDNFYIKTDSLEDSDQPILYEAARSGSAILENVKVLGDGEIDFHDSTITSNGRAVVVRSEMEDTNGCIDLPSTNMVIFLTRRNTIIPPVAKLDNEQAAAFFMLGESMGSSASDTDAGKPRRVVGTNPFIIGPREEEGNRFYEIIRANPALECYILNTGSIGEGGDLGIAPEKITVRDSATIIRELAGESAEWKKDPDWGYLVPESISGVEDSKFHPEKHYSPGRYSELTRVLKEERREWLSGFGGLDQRITSAI